MPIRHRHKWQMALLLVLLECTGFSQTPINPHNGLGPILRYIHSNWDGLTRSTTRCESIVDPKLQAKSILYLPADFAGPAAVEKLAASCRVRVERLPITIERPGQIDMKTIKTHGLLFLPNPYVVPGGRFNEMYGWDSYFILLGLLQDGRIDLARGMVDNFLFEIDHYGTVLNANRTYYLTRSQPPFLSSMIMAVHSWNKNAHRDDQTWLASAYEHAARDYQNWVKAPHMAGETGLSRYYDFGDGPAPESVKDEAGTHARAAGHFLGHPAEAIEYIVATDPSRSETEKVGDSYTVHVCPAATSAKGPRCVDAGTISLSGDYYKGDRSMRESGFDISFRFGAYGAATHHFAPVCLNSLLYKTEKELEEMGRELGKLADAEEWGRRAESRKQLVDRYLWDNERGMYFDYNFVDQKKSTYEYASTFYPLWAGLASPEQAKAVTHNLVKFERPGGIQTSPYETGGQWDAPYGWAPLEWIAVDGLRRYNHNEDANRTALEFLSTVNTNFLRESTIREKYNVVTRSSGTQVRAGYQMNVVGFGWTNGVFLQLLHGLPEEMIKQLERMPSPAPRQQLIPKPR